MKKIIEIKNLNEFQCDLILSFIEDLESENIISRKVIVNHNF